jgi:CheY-like chemotaxis protein/nitrogen-specific signal transduction histidine kinase
LLETTLREQSDELTRANQELLKASRHKDEFLANMSHELRTPLTGVLGMSDALLEGVYGGLNEGQRRSVLDIQESGRHLLSLINDILDVAKIEAGMVTLETGQVAVKSVCQASVRFVKDIAQKKSIKLNLSIDDAVSSIVADERRLKQTLVNLLSNAAKFTGNGGCVGLEVKGDAGRREARFTVWDTGIGISPDGLRALFRPFVQLDAGLSRSQEGTGLGLVLVKRLTELHGGSLQVESVLGEGSRFSVVLPWVPAEDPQARPGGASPGGTIAGYTRDESPALTNSGPRILMVDDNPMSVRAVKDFLGFKGYSVDVAGDGKEGLARAEAICPDLILIDIQMPGLDGLEVIRRLRRLPQLSDTPIVALTAMAMRGDRELVLAAGASAYVSKPATLTELDGLIRELLAREGD